MRLGDAPIGSRISWHPTGSPTVRLIAVVTDRNPAGDGMVEVVPLAGGRAPCSPQRWPAGDDVTLEARPGRHLKAEAHQRAQAARAGLREPEPGPGRPCGRCGRTVAHYPAGHPYPHPRPNGFRCWPARLRQ